MGNILGIPLPYALQRTLKNENGIAVGIKEVVAYRHTQRLQSKNKKRFDLYDPFYSNDYEEMGIIIPKLEHALEHQRHLPKGNLQGSDSVFFCGFNSHKENILLKISRNASGLASVWLHLNLSNEKTYSLPLNKVYRVPKTGKETFAAGGLRLRCLLPMRKWRLAYSGMLREEDNITKTVRVIYCKFSFIWLASSDVYDLSCDISPSFWAQFLSSQEWKAYSPDISKYLKKLDRYVQAGNMSGTVQLDNGTEEVKHFWGTRKRSFNSEENNELSTEMEYFGYMPEGEMLYCGKAGLHNGISRCLQYGCIVMANSCCESLDTLKFNASDDSKDEIEFSKDKFSWKAKFSDPSHELHVQEFQQKYVLRLSPVALEFKDFNQIGNGLVICTVNDNCEKRNQSLPELSRNIFLPLLDDVSGEAIPLVINLKNPACRYTEVSGGKGSSLADLHVISDLDKSFLVPNGVVVTTSAYDFFVKSCLLEKMLVRLQLSAGKLQPQDFKRDCEVTSVQMGNHLLPLKIMEYLKIELENAFGTDFEAIKFAVRSSASGEDSEEMSAAGQMKTFLGVKGLKKICVAIVQCWISQFSYVACQYKRQNGQLLNSPMAVVIQEMVDADVAGVMFTCDPVTGNPSKISISSNYGIGESVVSATAEPDTIELKKSFDGDVKIVSTGIGRKSLMTVLKDDGVSDVMVPDDDSSACSLTADWSVRLSKLGILIEEAYGCHVDIEWAIKDNSLFLLQARPVTTSDKETDFEVIHGTDGYYRTEKEYFSIANVGEVMPGAMSNMGVSAFTKIMFEILMLRHMGKRNKDIFLFSPYFTRGFGIHANHVLFNVFDGLLRFFHGQHNFMTIAHHVTMLGRALEGEEMLKRATHRNQFYKPIFSPMLIYYTFKDFYCAGKHVAHDLAMYRNFKINLSYTKTAADMYKQIIQEWIKLIQPFTCHFECTGFSTIANTLLFKVLVLGNDGKWNQNVFNDVSYVLSSCYQVESVEVPLDIENLAKAILKDYGPDFEKLDTQEALMWLERADNSSGVRFREFLNKHGHRCVKEFDLYSKPWGSDPLPLVQIIQDTLGNADKMMGAKEPITTEDTINNLKTELNWKNRWFLKYIVPICRKGVGYRERSKSLTISLVHSLRGAYRQLAERLVFEGRLPSADLFYFLTHYELLQLLDTRSPILVQRATRRKNLFPKMDSMVLPEITEGFPQPINFEIKETFAEGSQCITGVPVSQGVATGRARVATSLKEAAEIKSGEILIAYSTDIGWSPYFPMLAGVVTELGGLISHGAVVAREYGLPCVVSAQGVTRHFKTGDLVQIDGNKGTITLLLE